MTRLTIITTLYLFLAAAGCSAVQVEHVQSTPPFGQSVHMAVESQKLNPLPANTEPVRGMDGKYVQSVMEKYQKGPAASESKKSQSQSVKINVGGK